MWAWLGDWADGLWNWVVVVLFLLLAACETFRPARKPIGTTALRWFANGSLYAVDTALLDFVVPAALATSLVQRVGLASGMFGLLSQWAGDPGVLVASVLLLDLCAYALHRVQHRVFFLWRFHVVHHADMDMDASTTLRHHPVEVLISSSITGLVFAVIGVPEWVFPIYALIGITSSLIQHVNAGSAGPVDQALQWVLVTPGMHQIHHSDAAEDYGTNFGTGLSIWDRMFGTYRRTPAGGRATLAFGVPPFTTPEYTNPRWAWMLPFALRRPVQSAAAANHAD